jgi:indolepyruvate ferredoxin oxidoreductase
MTGGQQVGERPEGHSVVQIAQSMRAEGAAKITIVTDEPEKYASVTGLPSGIAIQHRDTLDAVQREFREIQGTTLII